MHMINALIFLATIIGLFVFMEGVAWFLHKYVMHGVGWYLHEDHHRPRKGRFEKNDVFSIFFAAVSWCAFWIRYQSGNRYWHNVIRCRIFHGP